MKKSIFYILALCILSACEPHNPPNKVVQGVVVATVQTYNKAVLSGDVLRGMDVLFYNSSNSSGRVSEGQTATMVLSGIPEGWVTELRVWLHSNKTSGAGEISVRTGEYIILDVNGTLEQIAGTYSTLDIAISAESVPVVVNGEDIELQVYGTSNSLYISKMEVSYTNQQPQQDQLVLHYYTDSQQCVADTIIVPSRKEGVILPNVNDVQFSTKDWFFIGWSLKEISMVATEPLTYPASSRWKTDTSMTDFYAVYCDRESLVLMQDTSYVSGEYALVQCSQNEFLACNGVWNKGVLPYVKISQVDYSQNGLLQWKVDTIPNSLRYLVSFEGDSLLITQNGNYIGFGNNVYSKWAWSKAAYGSIFLHHDITYNSGQIPELCYWYAYSIIRDFDKNNQLILQYNQTIWDPTKRYWNLMPIGYIPSYRPATWTSVFTTRREDADSSHD